MRTQNARAFITVITAAIVLACGVESPKSIESLAGTQTSTLEPAATPSRTPIAHPTLAPFLTPIPSPTMYVMPTFTALVSSTGHICIPVQQPQPATVVEVVDGDTIKVQMDGRIYPVRYIGIDAPESTIQKEYFGKEASQRNFELVSGREVVLYRDQSETDRYDRLLRFVFVGDVFVNYELVRQGYANAKGYQPDTSCSWYFSEAEAAAQMNGLGLWAGQAALPTLPASAGSAVVIVAVNKVEEYVDIANDNVNSIDLTGWVLVSEKGDQRCNLDGVIQAGQTLRIWASSGPGFSCHLPGSIWNNAEPDPAVLYNAQGVEVSRFP